MDRQHALTAYAKAWAESEEEKIRLWVSECWTPTSTYVNPFTDPVLGLDGLTYLILDYPLMFPDAVVAPRLPADVHHNHARYYWRLSSTAPIRLLGKNFGRQLTGLDVIEFNDEQKIARVTSFFDELPSGPQADTPVALLLGSR